MRLAVPLVVACLAACGSVKDQHGIDAADQIDAPSCGPTDQVDSCGASCAVCTATGARVVPTCDGTACGTACGDGAPKCSDNSCSKLVFDFEDGTPQGLTTTTGATLTVASHGGSKALAVPVTFPPNTAVFLDVPVCLSGSSDISSRTLSATIFYDQPGAPTGQQYIVQAWTPAKGDTNTTFVGFLSIEANLPQAFSKPMSAASVSQSTATVEFEISTFGAAFSGTVWFDDITLQ